MAFCIRLVWQICWSRKPSLQIKKLDSLLLGIHPMLGYQPSRNNEPREPLSLCLPRITDCPQHNKNLFWTIPNIKYHNLYIAFLSKLGILKEILIVFYRKAKFIRILIPLTVLSFVSRTLLWPASVLQPDMGSGVLLTAIACNEIRSKVHICASQSFCHVSDFNFVPEDPFVQIKVILFVSGVLKITLNLGGGQQTDGQKLLRWKDKFV